MLVIIFGIPDIFIRYFLNFFYGPPLSAEQKQEVYYPRVSAEAEDVRYTIRGFGVLIKNDFEV